MSSTAAVPPEIVAADVFVVVPRDDWRRIIKALENGARAAELRDALFRETFAASCIALRDMLEVSARELDPSDIREWGPHAARWLDATSRGVADKAPRAAAAIADVVTGIRSVLPAARVCDHCRAESPGAREGQRHIPGCGGRFRTPEPPPAREAVRP